MEDIKRRRAKITTSDIVKFFKVVHGERYDYSKVEYKCMKTKVVIICKKHGEFSILPIQHEKRGTGCTYCHLEQQRIDRRDTTENFVLKSVSLFKNRYLYTKTVYGKTAHEPLTLTCRVHGDFLIAPNSHLSNKQGCAKCGKVKQIRSINKKGSFGWSRSNWIKRCEGKEFSQLYLVRCYNDEEEFLKVGITNLELYKRYQGNSKMPYNYEVVKSISLGCGEIFDLENKILSLTRDFKYTPKVYFPGIHECRSTSQEKEIIRLMN